MRWLERYITEGSPRLQHFAEITASLAKREPTVADAASPREAPTEEGEFEAGGLAVAGGSGSHHARARQE